MPALLAGEEEDTAMNFRFVALVCKIYRLQKYLFTPKFSRN
jgi:hypothetical protein